MKKFQDVPRCRFNIYKQNHASINHLTCSAPQVSPFILEKWSKIGCGRSKKSFFTKFLKIIKNYGDDTVMIPKTQTPKQPKTQNFLQTYVRSYRCTDIREKWLQYPIRSKLRRVKITCIADQYKENKISASCGKILCVAML